MVERTNRTLVERMRTMLKTIGLPKTDWAKATKVVCYIINRSPLTEIEMKTLMKMWIGKLANYSSLHIFGCLAYVMYNDQNRTKLDLKFGKGIFLGYVDEVKGHRLWDPTTHMIIISRYVIFVEDMLQSEEKDSTLMKKTNTISFIRNKQSEQEQSEYSEVVPKHNEQVLVDFEILEVRRSIRERRDSSWHLEFVMAIDVTYCLLTKSEEPSNY